jgi:ribosomal protein L11 methyltransferase
VAVRDGEWRVMRLELAEHLVDAVASFLADEGVPALVTGVRDVDAGSTTGEPTTVEAHVPAERAPGLLRALQQWLASLAQIEPVANRVRITLDTLPPLDWEAVFRHHHRPLAIGDRLLVAPPWDVPEAPGREVLVIEPGMAFGTGQHETTRTCLEEIEEAVGGAASPPVGSALDVGTGSGVLAAALARLGVPRVVALDVDASALPLARANLARNGAPEVALLVGHVAALRARFDLVVANLLADALVAEAGALTAAVAPCGRLIVSGVLDAQAAAVAHAFAGLRVTATRAAGPWRTLRLER